MMFALLMMEAKIHSAQPEKNVCHNKRVLSSNLVTLSGSLHKEVKYIHLIGLTTTIINKILFHSSFLSTQYTTWLKDVIFINNDDTSIYPLNVLQ